MHWIKRVKRLEQSGLGLGSSCWYNFSFPFFAPVHFRFGIVVDGRLMLLLLFFPAVPVLPSHVRSSSRLPLCVSYWNNKNNNNNNNNKHDSFLSLLSDELSIGLLLNGCHEALPV